MQSKLKARMREELESISKDAKHKEKSDAEELSFRESRAEWEGTMTLGDIQRDDKTDHIQTNKLIVGRRPHSTSNAEKPSKVKSNTSKNQITQKILENSSRSKPNSTNKKASSDGSSHKHDSTINSIKGLNNGSDSIAELSRALFGSGQKRENEPAGPSTNADMFLESMHTQNYLNQDASRSTINQQGRSHSQKRPSKLSHSPSMTTVGGTVDNRKMFALYRELEKLHKSSADSFRKLTTKYEELLTDFQPYDFAAEDRKEQVTAISELEEIGLKIGDKTERIV
jgi:hypothetical protein